MLKKHPYLLAGLIALLVALNLWRWLPAYMGKGGARGAQQDLGWTMDFPLPAAEGDRKAGRDLFSFGLSKTVSSGVGASSGIMHKAALTPAASNAVSAASGGPVLETPGGYRLQGTVFRSGKAQALLGKGEELIQVSVGEEVDGRYRVESIRENEVSLTEKGTGNTLKLQIWDQQGILP